MKHAYLILADAKFELLQMLVNSLDDSRNDIFIHIDRKVRSCPIITVTNSGLYFIENRIDVRWGDYSQIEAEYALIEASYNKTRYSYYHLLSGDTLPLKNQNYIHEYFEKHQGEEFIGYSELVISALSERKVRLWHIFPRFFRNAPLYIRGLRSLVCKMQLLFHIERNRNVNFSKGTNWVSITDDFAAYVLANKSFVRKTFTHTFCGDELFMQTLCYNSSFRSRIHSLSDETSGSMRLIKWIVGCVEWTKDDIVLLSKTDALYARKFSLSDRSFIEQVLGWSKIS